MKPDWKDAPQWAQWLAMDGDGDWFWYLHQPHSTPGGTDEYGEAFPLSWYPEGHHSLVEFAGMTDEAATIVADCVALVTLERRP